MPLCVGVAFKRVSRSYWFDPADLVLPEGTRVLVDTSRGLETGIVQIGAREVGDDDITLPLRRVLRIIDENDLAQMQRNRERAQEAFELTRRWVVSHDMPMKLLFAECTFDAQQVTVSFAAESRVDFRELVRDLAGHLHCKVQMHQVGARDLAKLVGGMGPCGRTLCCSTFLTEFAPISMKMAKDQSLFLNPVKFSGVCGKLMCCLRYEHETYVEANDRLPEIGEEVVTPGGPGRVVNLNLLKETAIVQMAESQAEVEYAATELSAAGRAPGGCRNCPSSRNIEGESREAQSTEEMAGGAVAPVEDAAHGGHEGERGTNADY